MLWLFGRGEVGGSIVLHGAQLRPTCLTLGTFQGVVVGDPLWLTVINNNAQQGIVHLVVRRPLPLRTHTGVSGGMESHGA